MCEYCAKALDPSSRRKTLVFCVNDAHADLVVHLLKAAFVAQYGIVDDDAVIKITGAADKPPQLIRRYKNEQLPNVAVTVDLLTTGVDVPEICNLVFMRRVNSRILFDQMLGRATRLCPDIDNEGDKEAFAQDSADRRLRPSSPPLNGPLSTPRAASRVSSAVPGPATGGKRAFETTILLHRMRRNTAAGRRASRCQSPSARVRSSS